MTKSISVMVAAAAMTTSAWAGVDTAVRAWGWAAADGMQVPNDLGSVAQIAAPADGEGHAVALLSNGAVRTWGWGFDTPTDLGPTLMLDTGNLGGYNPFVILLQADGRVRCFGTNLIGACDVPAALGPAVHVAAGSAHSVAVDRRGKVWCWGWNQSGQSNVPSDVRDAVMGAAGENFSMALLRDGTVRGWGALGVPQGLSGVVKVVGSWYFAVFLTGSGAVSGGPTPPIDLQSVVDVDAGLEHVVALQSDGTVRSWGNGALGQTSAPTDLSATMQVTAGKYFQMALTCDRNTRVLASPELLPFSFGTPRAWVAKGISSPRAGAVVRVTARGQLGTATRFLTVRADGVLLGTIFGANSGAGTCSASPSVALLPISAAQFASMSSDGAVEIRVEPSINATSAGCDTATLTVSLQYEGQIIDCDGNGVDDICQIESAPLVQDCNGNGIIDACEPLGSETDCDDNGVFDSCDIARGAPDEDKDGRPDECELGYGDLNLDGRIDGLDLAALLALWGIADPPYGDLNGDGTVGGADLTAILARWGPLP